MRYFLIILLFVFDIAKAQIPDFRLRFEQNGVDASGNAFAGHCTGDSIFSGTTYVEGNYSFAPGYQDNWESKGAYDLDDRVFSIAFNVRFWYMSGAEVLFTNKQNTGSYGIDIRWDGSNGRIYGRSISSGSGTNDFYTASSILSVNTWYHIVAVFDGGYVRIYLNGTKLTMADSSIVSDYPANDTLAIASTTDRTSGIDGWGYIDNFHLYSYELSTLQADSLYDNRTSPSFQLGEAGGGGGGPTYNPPQYRLKYRGVEYKPLYSGVVYYAKYLGASPSPSVSGGGYDSTYAISCLQKFAIPEDVDNGDYVGTWQKSRTYMNTGSISFSLLTSHNGAFTLTQNSSTTALIEVLDATKIDGKIIQQDTMINLVIRTTESGVGYEDDTAQVWIKENTYCHFFDLDAGSDGTGSKASPFNTTSGRTYTVGHGYFFKRGTSLSNGIINMSLGHVASAAHPTIFGAYYHGANPLFNGTSGGNSYFAFMGDWDYPTTRQVEYVDFYNLHTRNYDLAAYYVKRISNHLGWYNCTMNNCYRVGNGQSTLVLINEFPDVGSIGDSTYAYDFEIFNCYFDTTGIDRTSGGEKSFIKGAPGALIQNCYFGQIRGTITTGAYQIRFAEGSKPKLRHCYFEEIPGTQATMTSAHIQLRADDAEFTDCRFMGYGTGIYVTTPGTAGNEVYPDSMTVTNCLFRNMDYAGIYTSPSEGDAANHSVGDIIQDSKFENVPLALRLRDWYHPIIRRNFIQGTGATGIAVAEAAESFEINYNVIYGYTSNQIYLTLGSNHVIYNNTVDGSINCTGVTSATARNNFYISIPGVTTQSNNIYIGGIVTSLYFNDYTNHDYSLKITAADAIDKGYDVSLTNDIIGTSVPKGASPDIGAYEYIP